MIEYKEVSTERIYYVIFDKRVGAFEFWDIFTTRKFAHVWVITTLSNGNLLVIKPTPAECIIEEWPCTMEQARPYLTNSTSILEYHAKFSAFKHYIPRGIVTCVSTVKYILGMKGVFSFSPFSLHKQLIELGAIEYGKEISNTCTRSPRSSDCSEESCR